RLNVTWFVPEQHLDKTLFLTGCHYKLRQLFAVFLLLYVRPGEMSMPLIGGFAVPRAAKCEVFF
ncbi:MAG: hypothetical protein ACLTY5_02910, partial [Angelakisella sp.]